MKIGQKMVIKFLEKGKNSFSSFQSLAAKLKSPLETPLGFIDAGVCVE